MVWCEGKTITVEQILDVLPRLGIPHFQRGRVWGPDSIASLLESLFQDTPCGSFVFWKSRDNAANGVALDETTSTGIDYLVIDGQQRIRSLYEAYSDTRQDEDVVEDDRSDESEPSQRPKIWCVNLTQVEGFQDVLSPRGREFSQFVYAVDPLEASPQSPFRHNVLPLGLIEQTADWQALGRYHQCFKFKNGAPADDRSAQMSTIYQGLRHRILAIRNREFFVAVRKTGSLAEMASLYNRINGGGKQVEREERAFAKLVGYQPRTWDGLRDVFADIHPTMARGSRTDQPGQPGRDALLRREKERAFGFKLFIRVFLQVCQYHLGYRTNRTRISFDLVHRDSFTRTFKALSASEVERLWKEAQRVLGGVRRILRDELFCDDLRMLPDTNALMPVFQILIVYPEMSQPRYRPLLASCCLRLALADLTSRESLEIAHRLDDPHRVAFDVVPEMLKHVDEAAKKKLRKGLDGANSIQHRYVLLLYWLERYLGARDFRYDLVPQQPAVMRRGLRALEPPERPVCETHMPEKQHLAPFSQYRKIFGSEVRRTESHPLNNVGILTYISGELNALLGDTHARLGEPAPNHEPPDNLRAHLLGESPDDEVLLRYGRLRQWSERNRRSGAAVRPQRLRREFERLTAARRARIRDGFLGWLDELDRKVCAAFEVRDVVELAEFARGTNRAEPARPFLADLDQLDLVHTLRDFDLDNEVEDRIAVVLKHGRVACRDKPRRLIIRFTSRKGVWLEVSQSGVVLGLSTSLTGSLRTRILATVGLPDSQEERLALVDVPDFHGLVNLVPEIKENVKQAVRTSKGKAPFTTIPVAEK